MFKDFTNLERKPTMADNVATTIIDLTRILVIEGVLAYALFRMLDFLEPLFSLYR